MCAQRSMTSASLEYNSLHNRLLWMAKEENETKHGQEEPDFKCTSSSPKKHYNMLCHITVYLYSVNFTAQRDHSTPNGEEKGTFLSSRCFSREKERPHRNIKWIRACTVVLWSPRETGRVGEMGWKAFLPGVTGKGSGNVPQRSGFRVKF